jgi:hypothetical protein
VKAMKNETCHVSRGPLCMAKNYDDMDTDYLRAYLAYQKMTRWALYFNNTECVKNVINMEYYKMQKVLDDKEADVGKFGLYLFLGIAIGAVVVIAILLLVIYFKRKKGEDEETNEATTKLSPKD